MKRIGLFFILILLSLNGLAQTQKSLRQLKAELKKLESSIEITKNKMKEVRDVNFLPDLYFVLAELYVDKARYLYAITHEEEPDTPLAELDLSDSKKAKKQAIETFQRFIENFPKSPDLDKAYFFMAHEYRELGQQEDMVLTYQKITKEFPNSVFWEESQLVLGDHFLETKKDPQLGLEFYQKIVDRPPNPFTPLARYKMAWCYINLNKFFESLLSFEKILVQDKDIDLSQLPDLYKKTDVKRDALLAMVWPYSEQKKQEPSRANPLEYFERLSPNRATMQKVLSRLAKRLLLKEKVDDTLPVFFRLLEITTDLDERVSLVDSFYETYKRSKKIWPIEYIPQHIADTLARVRSSESIPAPEKKKMETNWEIYMRDFATQLQKRAKDTKSEDSYKNAIASYKLYNNLFPRTKYSGQMLINLAESYFALKNYTMAGYFYERTAKLSRPASRKAYIDSSIESYALALKTQDKLSKLELTESREGFRQLGSYFVKKYPKEPAVAMIRFNIGRTYYDERDFDRAVPAFKAFIKSFPRHKEVTTAGQLILDSFNQREDYANLIAAGKELIANRAITDQGFKKDVSEIIRQAEFRKVQDAAGDPKSRDYAKKLLSFASKYQGSDLGDQALYEAFIALKAKKDPEAYGPGEALLERHGNSKYAKDVMAQMGQMALNTADYRRASKYFETYSKKYSSDPASKELLRNAAQMRETMGDFNEASANYRALGDNENAVRALVLAQDWRGVSQLLAAKPLNSVSGNYWMGLALFRQGQLDTSKNYLVRSANANGGSFEEKSMVAHSLYLLGSSEQKIYDSIQLGKGDESQAVKQKMERLNSLDSTFKKAISNGNGRWTIASLYELGRANKEFAQFLRNASVPPGLNPSQQVQYKQAVEKQAKQFSDTAEGYFSTCIQSAQKFEVFTQFVKGCQSKGEVQVNEARENDLKLASSDKNSSQIASIRKQLYDAPRDTGLLMKLAQAYIAVEDYSMAKLVYNRILEIEPKNSAAAGWLGVTLIYINDLEAAGAQFKETLRRNRAEPIALRGLASLYKQFNFSSKLNSVAKLIKGGRVPAGEIHPWMRGL